MPANDADTDDAPAEATFYLDERDLGTGHSRWGFHDAAASRLPRFLLWSCALILSLALATGLVLDGWAFLRKNYWAPLLWVVIALLVWRFKFRQRPFFRITEDELAFRSQSHRAERRVAWGALERIDLAPAAVVLRRTGGGPVHLYLPGLSEARAQTLQDALTAAARRHDVPTEQIADDDDG